VSPAGKLAPPLVVGAATLACFAPILANGFVSFDDRAVFLENPQIREISWASLGWMFSTVYVAIYQPLTWLLYAVDYAVWGLDPTGYHATALLLHGANAVLMYLLARAILRRAEPTDRVGAAGAAAHAWPAAAAALFFSLHPLRVEPVAWASARGQVQASCFAFLTLLAYLRAQEEPARRGRWLAASAAAFAVCMLTKSLAIALPGALLVIDHFLLRRFGREPLARVLLEKVPFAAIAGLALVPAFLAKELTGSFALTGEIEHGPVERLLQAGYGLTFYLVKTLVPLALSPLHPLERQLAGREPAFLAGAAASVALTLALVTLRRRWPGLLGTWLAYAILAAPVLGFAQSGPQLVADRYSYLACVPFALLVGLGLLRRARRSTPRGRRALAAAAALALVLLGALSARQTRIWRDGDALWAHAVALHPESGLVRLFHANHLREEGRFEEAVASYDRALALGVHRAAEAHNGRAASHQALGHRDAARADADLAVALAPRNAGYHLNRGLVRAEGDLPGALSDFSRALRLDPGLAPAYYSRAVAYQALGQRAGAVADLERALSLGLPGSQAADARRRLAALRKGRPRGARGAPLRSPRPGGRSSTSGPGRSAAASSPCACWRRRRPRNARFPGPGRSRRARPPGGSASGPSP